MGGGGKGVIAVHGACGRERVLDVKYFIFGKRMVLNHSTEAVILQTCAKFGE